MARRDESGVVLEPSGERLDVQRLFAVPRILGPALEGVPSDEEGFIRAGDDARVVGCERTWAAGDGVVSPVKFGGLATHQARRAAAAIARLAGAEDAPDPGEPVIHGRLLVGRRSRRLQGRGDAEGAPLWWPQGKVAGEHLPRWLTEHGVTPATYDAPAGEGVTVRQPLSRISGAEQQLPVGAGAPVPQRRPRDRLAGPPHARGARALRTQASGPKPARACGRMTASSRKESQAG